MSTLSEIFSSSLLAAVLVKAADFVFSFIKKRNDASIDILIHTKKIFFSKRMELIEEIFFTVDKARHAINTLQNTENVNSVICSISKSEIPRTVYFNDCENIKIDEIIDQIKIQSVLHTSFKELDVKIEDLRICLGINFVR